MKYIHSVRFVIFDYVGFNHFYFLIQLEIYLLFSPVIAQPSTGKPKTCLSICFGTVLRDLLVPPEGFIGFSVQFGFHSSSMQRNALKQKVSTTKFVMKLLQLLCIYLFLNQWKIFSPQPRMTRDRNSALKQSEFLLLDICSKNSSILTTF